jgi:thioredoxin 1
MTKEVTDSTFNTEVINSEQPVLIDFWAEWCGPCRQLTPIIDEVSKELEGKVKVVKMNIDHNPQTPSQLGVRGIPTLMIFKNGVLSGTKVGALPKSNLLEWINDNI